MERFFSKVQPDLLLHMIFRIEDFKAGRVNIIPPDNFLQCAALKLTEGQTFKPHKHIENIVTDNDRKAQESWFVIWGTIQCTFYDIDDTILAEPYIRTGDASFTLHGGHTYTCIEDDSFVLEYKTGRYLGQEKDKVFI